MTMQMGKQQKISKLTKEKNKQQNNRNWSASNHRFVVNRLATNKVEAGMSTNALTDRLHPPAPQSSIILTYNTQQLTAKASRQT